MSTETPNIKLKKLESTDLVARTLFNVNADILDTQIGNLKTKDAEQDTEIDQLLDDNSETHTRLDSLESAVTEIDDALNEQETKNTAFTQKDQQLQEGVTALETALEGKADKSYVDDGFYTKEQSDATFLTKAAYKDQRVITFLGSDFETRYPWAGTVQQIQINCPLAKESDIAFQVERQSEADYVAKLDNWQKIGGQIFSFPAGSVYKKYAITTGGDVLADDILRLSTENDDNDLTAQAFIQNN